MSGWIQGGMKMFASVEGWKNHGAKTTPYKVMLSFSNKKKNGVDKTCKSETLLN